MNVTTTPCNYLFGKEAVEIFPQAPEADKHLTKLMNLVDQFVITHPEAFFLLDPTAFNDQCHLYALISVQSIRQANMPDLTESDKIDKRFLYHFFLLSYAFLTDGKLLDQFVIKALSASETPSEIKAFLKFLKTPHNYCIRSSRMALNRLFEHHMKQVAMTSDDPLYRELQLIANDDLQITASNGQGSLYTFPKIAGVAYFIDALAKENIPLVFKVKVISNEGNGSFSYSQHSAEDLNPKEPVILFELVATGPTFSYLECRDDAKKCPSHSRRSPKREDRHPEESSCLFCSPLKTRVAPYAEKFTPTLANTQEMLLALGADFVREKQPNFLRFFTNEEQFPYFTALFQKYNAKISDLFLSMSEPLNLSVSHVGVESAERAFQEEMIIDANYGTHLKNRDLV